MSAIDFNYAFDLIYCIFVATDRLMCYVFIVLYNCVYFVFFVIVCFQSSLWAAILSIKVELSWLSTTFHGAWFWFRLQIKIMISYSSVCVM